MDDPTQPTGQSVTPATPAPPIEPVATPAPSAPAEQVVPALTVPAPEPVATPSVEPTPPPVAPSVQPEVPATPAPATPVTIVSDSGKKRVLIIEDERPLAHALELKINHEGYETHVSLTGADGLKEAMTGSYAVLLLDLIMPELDGFSLLEKLVHNGIKTPVLVLSNLGQEEDKTKAKNLGARDYFVKANTPIVDIVKRMKEVML